MFSCSQREREEFVCLSLCVVLELVDHHWMRFARTDNQKSLGEESRFDAVQWEELIHI